MPQLNLNMDPQEALDNINTHDHASGLGNQITTASVVNNAITANKLATDAVTTEKIANNAVTTEKVADGSITVGKIAAGVLANSGVVGLTDYIGKGSKIKPNADLSVAVEPMEASIAGAYQQTSTDKNVSLDARKASLIYAQKGTGGEPVLGRVNAVYPDADDNTVLRYTFGEVGNPQDTSGNENHITTMVGCTRVDGWTDYAKKGDGSTGYMVSGATTGFPTGASERQLTVLWTCVSTSGTKRIVEYGTTATNAGFGLTNYAGELYLYYGSGSSATGFMFEVGKTYLLDFCYDGTNVQIYVNGMIVYKAAWSCSTVATVMQILRYSGGGTYYEPGIVHYLELRNKMRTPAQIGQISNALLLPCRHDKYLRNVDASTTENAISGGDNASYPKKNAFDGSMSTYWASLQTGTGVSGVSYIGQNFGEQFSCIGFTISQVDAATGLSSVKAQKSSNGTDWTDIGTYTITDGSGINIVNFSIGQTAQYFRLLANDNPNAGASWCAYDVEFVSAINSVSDIRSVLPADSISLGLVRTSSTVVTEIDDSSYKYGRREGATGGNRKVFLGWKYFSGQMELRWNHPFDTRKVKTYFTYAENNNGMNECDINNDYYNGSVNVGLLTVYNQYSAHHIVTTPSSGGVVRLNGTYKTSGYIGCYAEVTE